MFVIVFEETFDVFGPFASIEEAEAHLTQHEFIEASKGQHYWNVGDCWCFIKEVSAPRAVYEKVEPKLKGWNTDQSGRLMCIDGKTACDPNDKPAGYCNGCGG